MMIIKKAKGGLEMKYNMTIRKAAKESRVPLWAVADAMNISEPTMTRKLRHELPQEETERILAIIARIAGEARK